jgi:succinyl-CoA synthetase beta subunit
MLSICKGGPYRLTRPPLAVRRYTPRGMDLYEYQGKQLFVRFGIPVSDGMLATTVAEARTAAEQIGSPVMVKAQVLVGGRGKAGGIKFAADPDAAEQHAANILGMDISGHVVRRLWIERASDIEREYYFSITLDRGAKRPLFMLTTAGGIEIEQVAEQTPERLARMHVDPLAGFLPADAAELCAAASIPADEVEQVSEIMLASYRAFVETDAMLVEINPLIVTPDGIVRALDSKYTIDDNALFRHPEIAEMRDVEAADPQERMARKRGVNFVKLDGGDIGTLANGAGLAMSTLDVVAAAGRSTGHRPANFLDVGGGANAEAIATAMEVLLSDVEVRQGILTALDRLGTTLPIVVRLDGTNAEQGLRMLAEAAPANVHVEKTMLGAAARVVELVDG